MKQGRSVPPEEELDKWGRGAMGVYIFSINICVSLELSAVGHITYFKINHFFLDKNIDVCTFLLFKNLVYTLDSL